SRAARDSTMAPPAARELCSGGDNSLVMPGERTALFSPRLPLYSWCRIRPAMAINAVVIRRSDPGGVPGASTKCRRLDASQRGQACETKPRKLAAASDGG